MSELRAVLARQAGRDGLGAQPFLFAPPVDSRRWWRWRSWADVAAATAGSLPTAQAAAPDRPADPFGSVEARLRAGTGWSTAAAALARAWLATEPGASAGADGLGPRPIAVWPPDLGDEQAAALLAWALEAGAALVVGIEAMGWAPAVDWARPTVLVGTWPDVESLLDGLAAAGGGAERLRRPRAALGRLDALLLVEASPHRQPAPAPAPEPRERALAEATPDWRGRLAAWGVRVSHPVAG